MCFLPDSYKIPLWTAPRNLVPCNTVSHGKLIPQSKADCWEITHFQWCRRSKGDSHPPVLSKCEWTASPSSPKIPADPWNLRGGQQGVQHCRQQSCMDKGSSSTASAISYEFNWGFITQRWLRYMRAYVRRNSNWLTMYLLSDSYAPGIVLGGLYICISLILKIFENYR